MPPHEDRHKRDRRATCLYPTLLSLFAVACIGGPLFYAIWTLVPNSAHFPTEMVEMAWLIYLLTFSLFFFTFLLHSCVRCRRQPFPSRSFPMLVVSCSCAYLIVALVSLEQGLDLVLPCGAMVWVVGLVYPSVFIPYILRGVRLRILFRSNRRSRAESTFSIPLSSPPPSPPLRPSPVSSPTSMSVSPLSHKSAPPPYAPPKMRSPSVLSERVGGCPFTQPHKFAPPSPELPSHHRSRSTDSLDLNDSAHLLQVHSETQDVNTSTSAASTTTASLPRLSSGGEQERVKFALLNDSTPVSAHSLASSAQKGTNWANHVSDAHLLRVYALCLVPLLVWTVVAEFTSATNTGWTCSDGDRDAGPYWLAINCAETVLFAVVLYLLRKDVWADFQISHELWVIFLFQLALGVVHAVNYFSSWSEAEVLFLVAVTRSGVVVLISLGVPLRLSFEEFLVDQPVAKWRKGEPLDRLLTDAESFEAFSNFCYSDPHGSLLEIYIQIELFKDLVFARECYAKAVEIFNKYLSGIPGDGFDEEFALLLDEVPVAERKDIRNCILQSQRDESRTTDIPCTIFDKVQTTVFHMMHTHGLYGRFLSSSFHKELLRKKRDTRSIQKRLQHSGLLTAPALL